MAMAAFLCPWCKSMSTFGIVWTGNIVPRTYASIPNSKPAVLQCSNTDCYGTVTGVVVGMHVRKYWPEAIGGKDFPDVPVQIAGAANEAHMCLSIGANRGAVALARAVVEAMAKEKGVTSGNLYAKIAKLAEENVISDAMRDAADEIRFAGNEVAHGDLAEEPITADDASEILALMDAILLRVYQEPAQVARVRERRQARDT